MTDWAKPLPHVDVVAVEVVLAHPDGPGEQPHDDADEDHVDDAGERAPAAVGERGHPGQRVAGRAPVGTPAGRAPVGTPAGPASVGTARSPAAVGPLGAAAALVGAAALPGRGRAAGGVVRGAGAGARAGGARRGLFPERVVVRRRLLPEGVLVRRLLTGAGGRFGGHAPIRSRTPRPRIRQTAVRSTDPVRSTGRSPSTATAWWSDPATDKVARVRRGSSASGGTRPLPAGRRSEYRAPSRVPSPPNGAVRRRTRRPATRQAGQPRRPTRQPRIGRNVPASGGPPSRGPGAVRSTGRSPEDPTARRNGPASDEAATRQAGRPRVTPPRRRCGRPCRASTGARACRRGTTALRRPRQRAVRARCRPASAAAPRRTPGPRAPRCPAPRCP
ncbi:hypothetical protein SALBM217S_02360 [Streptomyces griseoloalbus]